MPNLLLELLLKMRDEATGKLAAVREQVRATAKVVSGVAPEAARGARGIEELASAFGLLSPAAMVVASATVAVGALALASREAIKAVRELSDTANNLKDLSQRTGMALGDVQALAFGFSQSGISAERFAEAVKFLNRSIAEGRPELKAIGATSKDTKTALLQMADAFMRAADGPIKTSTAMQILGRSGEQMIPVLNRGAAGLLALSAMGYEVGAVFSDTAVGGLSEAHAKFLEMDARVKGLRDDITLELLPAVLEFLKGMNGLLKAVRETSAAFGGFGAIIGNVTGWMAEHIPYVGDMIAAYRTLTGLFALVHSFDAPPAAFAASGGMMPSHGEGFGPKKPKLKTVGEEADMPTWIRVQLAYIEYMEKEAIRIGKEIQKFYGDLAKAQSETLKRSIDKGKQDEPTMKLPAEDESQQRLLNILHDWALLARDLTSAAGMLKAELGAVFDGLTTGFQNVFIGLLDKTQTFKSAMASIFKSLVSSVLAELGRIVAAKVFGILLKLIGTALFGPAGAAAADMANPIFTSARPANGLNFAAAGAGGGSVTQIFNVNAIDSRSVADAYRSYDGAFARFSDEDSLGQEQ